MTETIPAILHAHRSGRRSPRDTVSAAYARIRAYGDAAVFISLRDEGEALAEADRLATRTDLPLQGVPIAVKDNIDVAGLPTTAACPAFAYVAAHDAGAVAKLRAAGAIVVGKTNLDQFATGLVGLRSPYGTPRNPVQASLIPGGSSSGSAAAVAAGLVPVALGTDTAGSGRVPAGMTNIVGLKPSVGVVSTAGVVPACRTLDCVSVFALTVDDAWSVFGAMAGPDRADAYSRPLPVGRVGAAPAMVRVGVPRPGVRLFFGDSLAAQAYEAALVRLATLGATLVEIDIEPFYETARLLYEGPWLAERYLAIGEILSSSPEALHPVTREIIIAGARQSATDAFAAFYRLQDLRCAASSAFAQIDMLALPTMPSVYTVEQVRADPYRLNSRLGTYTNFVNLLDLCALAIPASMRPDGAPSGITLVGPRGTDAALAAIGRVFHADTGLPLGATGAPQPPLAALPQEASADEIVLAVVGAHLAGLPLNHELRDRGARLLRETKTVPDYKLFALPDATPPKPGLLRVDTGTGSAVDLELWALSAQAFGTFVAAVPPPMSIGTIRLADGSQVKGFLVEAQAVTGARDISHHGGWRRYLDTL